MQNTCTYVCTGNTCCGCAPKNFLINMQEANCGFVLLRLAAYGLLDYENCAEMKISCSFVHLNSRNRINIK